MGITHDYLEELRGLTAQLRSEDLFEAETTGPFTAYQLETERGTAFSLILYRSARVAVMKVFCSAGTVIPCHSHGDLVKEILVVTQGEMTVRFADGTERTVCVSDEVSVPPGVIHSAGFAVDTWFIAITIPAAASWPAPR